MALKHLIGIILAYESDTFDAKARRVTRKEAIALAKWLFADLCKIVEQGGRMSCDGLLLSYRLAAMRGE